MNKPNELSGGIFSAFVRAQKAFGPALKTSSNPHFKSKYADLSACIEAVIDALNAEGIALIQKTHECSDGVAIETVFLHSSGESFSSGVLRVPAVKQDAQGYGSALTYARRYSLMAACGIAPEDDDGNAAARAPRAPEGLSDGAVADHLAAITAADTMDELQAAFGSAYGCAKAAGDKAVADRFTKAKDARKAALTA